MKVCSKCKIEKDESEFHIEPRQKDGLRSACKECINAQNRACHVNNREARLTSQKKYRLQHLDAIRYKDSQWQKAHRATRNAYMRVYESSRRKSDINFRLSKILRTRLGHAVSGTYKANSTLKLVGCELDFLKYYLESLFAQGMTWDNYGRTGWHIDHIKPCAAFDLSDPEQQKQCFHYTNLQPLWAEDNIRKSDKWEEPCNPTTPMV